MRLFVALMALGLSACGAFDDDSALPLGVEIQGLTADQVGKVQIVVLSHGKTFSCPDLRSTCLKSRVIKQSGAPIDYLVKLKDAEGAQHNALLLDVDGGKLTGAGQTFQAKMAPGNDYLVVAEVLSKDASPTLLASGCSSVLPAVGAGTNSTVSVQAFALAVPATCDVVIP